MRKPVFRVSDEVVGLYNHQCFRNKRDCTIYVVKLKALISCTVTAQLICTFVFRIFKKQIFS